MGERHYAVKGTPTDCVIMAIRHVMRETPPDLVLSGVNLGGNVAEDVSYSGTIAAAIEGTMLGFPSIALSQAYGAGGRNAAPWSCAEAHGARMVRKIIELGMPKGTLVNVNFPPCEPDEVVGVAAATQGTRDQEFLRVEERRDGRGNPYFWIAFARTPFEPGHGTDLWAMRERRISVTPLRLNMTDEPTLTRFPRTTGPRGSGPSGRTW